MNRLYVILDTGIDIIFSELSNWRHNDNYDKNDNHLFIHVSIYMYFNPWVEATAGGL
jgi:hypothetical protein